MFGLNQLRRSFLSLALLCVISVCLMGCGGVDGTYSGTQEGETMTVTLDGGKYTMTIKSSFDPNATPSTGDYTVEGKTVTLHGTIPMPFTLDGDKLIGPFGISLIKQ